MSIKRMKTSELVGPALDWAVAVAVGARSLGIGLYFDKKVVKCEYDYVDGQWWWTDCFDPSADWELGGPLIDRERIKSHYSGPLLGWECWCGDTGYGTGSTHLIASMRCLVASKLGDFIDIPEALKEMV